MRKASSRPGGIAFHSPRAFWFGVVAVTAGVLLHVPMFARAGDVHYRLAGMHTGADMIAGMVLIVVGLAATAYALFPARGRPDHERVANLRVRALDDASITRAHVVLVAVMAIAVTIDVMKPVTLSFVIPGMAREYGLRSPLHPSGPVPVALLPLCGIAGTVVGSFLWGSLGDRVGRRSSILFAGILFMATAICGSMPDYRLNFVMCFVMGLGVGGMLPIAFALLAETVPARHRGWLLVLIGGDVAGAYIITSWLSSALTPDYSWRILWLLGFPTGLLLMLVNRWIPESPRFLIANGREREARAVMRRYGAEVVETDSSELAAEDGLRASFAQLLARRFAPLTFVVALAGVGVGLVTFGFQLWIPTNLQKLGFDGVTSDGILRDSALIGFPVTLLVAWAYGLWSSRKTMIVVSLATAVALAGLVVAGDAVAHHRLLLYALLAIPISGTSSVIAVIIAYSSEVYPTKIRSRGAGLAAGASKAGGVIVIAFAVASIAPPSIALTAGIGAVPMALAALATAVVGLETHRRPLEEITADELMLGAGAGGALTGIAPD